MPINTTYGSNITYSNSDSDNKVNIKGGSMQNITIILSDQNNNLLNILDPNILITLNIKFP